MSGWARSELGNMTSLLGLDRKVLCEVKVGCAVVFINIPVKQDKVALVSKPMIRFCIIIT